MKNQIFLLVSAMIGAVVGAFTFACINMTVKIINENNGFIWYYSCLFIVIGTYYSYKIISKHIQLSEEINQLNSPQNENISTQSGTTGGSAGSRNTL